MLMQIISDIIEDTLISSFNFKSKSWDIDYIASFYASENRVLKICVR